jgi:hypothetical protein
MEDTYIVRVYRRNQGDPEQVLGVVEEIGVAGNQVFTNLGELGQILIASRAQALETQESK